MIKNTSDDNALKCRLAMQEPQKFVADNALSADSKLPSLKMENKLKVTQIENGIKLNRKWLGKISPELFNLEGFAESEKPIKIDLKIDLYQMENI